MKVCGCHQCASKRETLNSGSLPGHRHRGTLSDLGSSASRMAVCVLVGLMGVDVIGDGRAAFAQSGRTAAARPSENRSVVVPRVLVTAISDTEVPAQVAGVLAEVAAREGTIVAQGDTLARVDDAEARMTEALAEIEMAIAEKQASATPLVEAAEAAHEVAKSNLRRAEESLANFGRSISQAEMDEYRLRATETKTSVWEQRHKIEIAGLTHRHRRQQLDLAQDRSQRHRVLAPVNGMVKEVPREVGEWVIPGQPIARIIRLDRLRCVGFLAAETIRLHEGDAELVGMEATLFVPSIEAPDAKTFRGTLTFLDPEIEPESDQIRIWVEVENVGLKLRPGDRGTLVLDFPNRRENR